MEHQNIPSYLGYMTLFVFPYFIGDGNPPIGEIFTSINPGLALVGSPP
jgi:hypothetical protein